MIDPNAPREPFYFVVGIKPADPDEAPAIGYSPRLHSDRMDAERERASVIETCPQLAGRLGIYLAALVLGEPGPTGPSGAE